MLRRKVEQTLLTWKNTPNRKPLILKGCRQCGKTYSVLEFAKKNYEHTVYLNFFENSNFDTYNSLTPNWYYKVLR